MLYHAHVRSVLGKLWRCICLHIGWIAFCVATAIVLYRLRAFLPMDTLPARGDPSLPFPGSDLTPRHVPDLVAAIRSFWHEGVLPAYNPLADGGVPLFQAPESGVFSLATLLGGFVRYEAAIKWSILVHVVVGMSGVFAFARRLQVAAPFAALGALAFALGTFLLAHLRLGHMGFVFPMCLMPWSMVALYRALEDERARMAWAVACGALMAAGILEGGTTPVYYETLGLASACPVRSGGGRLAYMGEAPASDGRAGCFCAGCDFRSAARSPWPSICR